MRVYADTHDDADAVQRPTHGVLGSSLPQPEARRQSDLGLLFWKVNMNPKRFFLIACIVLAIIAVGRYYYNPGTITLPDGKVVPDLSVAKAGPLSGDKFKPTRRTFLTSSFNEYKQMEFVPSVTDVSKTANRLKTLLMDELLTDERDKKAVAELPQDALDDLCQRIALVLTRASGMPLAEYKSHLGADEALIAPTHFLEEEDALVQGLSPAAAFDKLYDAAGAGDYRVTGWALSSRGIRTAFKRLPLDQNGDVLFERLSGREDYRIFHGDMAKGSLMFHRSANLEKVQSQALMCFEIAMIVEDSDGDRYPLWLTLFYEPDAKRWWLFNAYRMASPEATNRPRLAF